MAIRRCSGCSKFLPKPSGKRGRPSLKCDKCKPVKVITIRECRDCAVPLPAPEGRGRPPVKCDECRTKKAKEKVLISV